MGRIVSWIANAALGVLCCFLVAQTLLQLVGVALSAIPAAPSRPSASAMTVATRGARDRQVILQRNLFNVSTLVATAPAATEEEDLEATKLPLKLLGTAASNDPKLSWAAVEDLETRQHLVVRPDDLLKQQARVVRIERRRIVLENGARREELALDEGDGAGGSVRTGATGRPGGLPTAMATPQPVMPSPAPGADAAAQARVRRLADNRFAIARSDIASLARNPAAILSGARMIPKYDPNGQMQGFQLNAVQPGSFWEQVGIQSGDIVTMFNGQRIDSPESSASVLSQITQARSVNVVVQGSDGRERTLTYEFQE